MRQLPTVKFNSLIVFLILLLNLTVSQAQPYSKIDWSKDTISKADAIGAKSTYLNTIKGSGQKNATERINLPVDKIKEIIDACDSKGVTEISVMFISLRQSDLAHYRKSHPESAATDDQLKGSQMLVFRIPRMAMAGAMGAKINSGNNPLLVSLLASGLVMLDTPFTGLPAGSGDLFFLFGGICPPPTSCDTD
jgi:hypothetical protein